MQNMQKREKPQGMAPPPSSEKENHALTREQEVARALQRLREDPFRLGVVEIMEMIYDEWTNLSRQAPAQQAQEVERIQKELDHHVRQRCYATEENLKLKQEIERLNKLIKERSYRDEANATVQLQLLADKAKRIDDLKHQLAAMRAERDEACGELLVSLDDAPIGSLAGKLVTANRVLRSQLAASQARVRELEVRKDGAYLERNHLVAALARCFPSGIRKTAIEGWSDDWHGCVYIDLPAGQISYHYHDSQAFLFESLPAYGKPYDGHTKDDVHDRLKSAQLQATLAERDFQWSDELAKALPGLSFMSFVGPESTAQWVGQQLAAREQYIQELKSTQIAIADEWGVAMEQRDTVRQDAARLREALKFYADPHSYGLNGGSNERIIKDHGQQAQKALKGA